MQNKNEILRSEISKSVLRRYARAIVHMRQQLGRKQFGPVFGAGIGLDLKFPSWNDLLARIAKHPSVRGEALAKRTQNSTSIAQQFFMSYRSNWERLAVNRAKPPKMAEMELRAGWRKVVHECLYKDIPKSIDTLLKRDKYLEAFVPLIQRSPLTVTYNFDDTLQRLLQRHGQLAKTNERGFRTCWSGNVQLQSRSGGVIYHPNGFLPFSLRERPSDHLVFSEDSFADQLIDSMAGQYGSLSTHFSQTTCLLVGLSLSDPTLKHLLRQNATHFPGHFHYYVKFVSDGNRDEKCESVESAANFDVYNLNTLFLNAAEISALAKLIAADELEFTQLAQEVVKTSAYRFFVVGCVAAGKSTTVGHFRSMLTQDEWTKERAPNMEKAPDLLTREERKAIDLFVAEEVGLKNMKLLESTKSGIHVIDRAPLDAFAFTLDKRQWKSKAKLLRSAVSPGLSHDHRKLAAGHVIFLKNDPEVMAERAISLHKNTTSRKLENQQNSLLHVYSKLRPKGGVTVIDVFRKTPQEVVKDVAHVIFRKEYIEADMHKLLLQIESNGYEE
ncbi:SIR2 family protein [Paraburkholderia caledonica]|uniref:SIR2-like domain-containing protein n=1 Tax=Paraburkholderia caledonica TaxID=134536 RepID=A0AB73IMN4_9BURK|nr:hypothetical protein [Paraburkholderia caledonica]